MLRIKKEIDLKDLEKFGFEYNDNRYECEKRVSDNIVVRCNGYGLCIFSKLDYSLIFDLDILYDIITAGYVEKVEE